MYDCLRANKSLAAWGVEGRVPFLDKEFIDVAMSLNPQDKMINGERMEKWVLRKAFEGYLPDDILWRQKEQFSDGVGYSWIDTLKEVVEEIKQENLLNLWKRFGKIIIAVVTLFIIGIAGFKGWESYDRNQREHQSLNYNNLINS